MNLGENGAETVNIGDVDVTTGGLLAEILFCPVCEEEYVHKDKCTNKVKKLKEFEK